MAGSFDDAAKSGGSASDPELIESVLRRAEGVRHVAVVWRDDRPVAYVMPATVDAAALRAHVAANLPGSSARLEFLMVGALPLTANGRVDRAALSAPDYVVPTARGYVAPRTETERILARVWADVLGVERVGIEDNFFDLAGDSIDSIHLVARAKEAGLHFTSEDVFRLKTVAAIAATSRLADPAAGTPDFPADSPPVSLSRHEIEAIEAKWR
jgi:acyl carrier protein